VRRKPGGGTSSTPQKSPFPRARERGPRAARPAAAPRVRNSSVKWRSKAAPGMAARQAGRDNRRLRSGPSTWTARARNIARGRDGRGFFRTAPSVISACWRGGSFNSRLKPSRCLP